MSQTKILLGKRIRSLRRQKDYSQEQLAEMAELSVKYLGEIERGRANISIELLANTSNALGISISELLDYEHEAEREVIIKEISLLIKSADDQSLQVIYRIIKSLLK